MRSLSKVALTLNFIVSSFVGSHSAHAECTDTQAKQIAVDAFKVSGTQWHAKTLNYSFLKWSAPSTHYLLQGFVADGKIRDVIGPPPVSYGPWRKYQAFCNVQINDHCEILSNICHGLVETIQLQGTDPATLASEAEYNP